METTKDYLKLVGLVIVFIVTVGILGFVANAMGLANFAFFAPKIQQVQTNVFKEGQAYNDGMANDLADLQIKYMSAQDPAAKDAIRAIIKQRFASYDTSRLPPNLQTFYNSL